MQVYAISENKTNFSEKTYRWLH